jgi:hypothetical protein
VLNRMDISVPTVQWAGHLQDDHGQEVKKKNPDPKKMKRKKTENKQKEREERFFKDRMDCAIAQIPVALNRPIKRTHRRRIS